MPFCGIYLSKISIHSFFRKIIRSANNEDRPNNESFISKLGQVQYNVALAITGAIKCTSCSKLYNELGLESLEFRRRLRHLCFLHKIM